MIDVGVLTVSDLGSKGEREDLGGRDSIDISTERLDARVKEY